MNIKEYISSGIVESYVMGLAAADEQREFEQACARYPEVLAARQAFEEMLEREAMQHALPVPAALREELMVAIASPQEETPVVPLPARRHIGWQAIAAAVAIVLLAVSLVWNLTLQQKNNRLQQQIAGLQSGKDSAMNMLGDMEKDMQVLTSNPHVKMAGMKGTAEAPAAYATVYWDSLNKDVYLMVNNLPAPPSQMQYQLWALINGEPVDAGMIPNDVFIGRKKLLLTMKSATGAQAFAITLEKKGGNPTPQGKMYTLGNL